jgi:Ca2+-binding RTX toxin-like protein
MRVTTMAMMFAITAGQSLAYGTTTIQDPLTTTALYPTKALGLNFGPSNTYYVNHGWAETPVVSSSFLGFTPLLEYGSETVSSSMVNRIIQEFETAGLQAPTIAHFNVAGPGKSILTLMTSASDVFANVTAALSSTTTGSLFAINVGGGNYSYYLNNGGTAQLFGTHSGQPVYFDNLVTQLTLAHGAAVAGGYDVDPRILVNWIQGQSDTNLLPDQYEFLLGKFLDKVKATASSILQTQVQLVASASQHRGYGDKMIAIDQIDFISARPDVVFGAPEYQFEARYPSVVSVDYTHLSAEGYYMMGQQIGSNLFDALRGQENTPILISGVSGLDADSLLVSFSGLSGNLVADPAIFASINNIQQPTDLGFRLYTEQGYRGSDLPEILDAQIVGPNQVRLDFSAAVVGPYRLYLGRNEENLTKTGSPNIGELLGFGGTTLRDSVVGTAMPAQDGTILADPSIYEFAPIQYVNINFSVTPNRNPVVTTPVAISGNEDTAIAGTLVASDPDGDVLGYALSTGPAKGTVTLNASTGAFTYTPTLNSNGADSFGIVVNDGKGGTATATVNVSVAAINDAPTSIGVTGGPIAENSTNGAVIGTLSTLDVDVGNTFSYTLVTGTGSTDNNLVSIVGNQLRVNGAIDFETNPTLELRVRSTDQGNLFTERTLVVNVTDVNEPGPNQNPVVTTPVAISGNEDTAITGTLTASDPDGDTLGYTIGTGPAKGTVTLNAATGAFTYNPTPNSNGADTFGIVVSDGKGGSATAIVNVSVASLNDTPTSIGFTGGPIAENSANGAVVGVLATTDVDVGDTFSYTLVTGTGSDDNNLVSFVGNQLRVTGAIDFETNPTLELRVRSTDQGALFTESAFVVNVTDVLETGPNQNPVVTTPVSVSGNEDIAITGTLEASDPDGDTLSYALGTGPTSGSVTVNSTTGAFTYQPTLNSNGADSFGIVVSDGKGGTATATVNVSVAAINDAPTSVGFTGGPIAENSANGTLIGTLSTVDVDIGDTFSYSLVTGTGSADNNLVSLVGNQIRVNGAIDFETNATVELRVRSTDQDSLFTESAFVVNVTDVNEAVPNRNPVVTTPVAVSGNEDTSIAGSIVASDPDGDVLGYTLSTGPTFGLVTLNASTGTFTYTPTLNSNWADTFDITVSDAKGGTATATVNVSIAAINDTPTSIGFTGGPIAENSANGSLIGVLATTDVDVGDTFSYTLVTGTGSTDNTLVSIVGNQLRVNGAIDFETNPTLELRIRSTDQGALFTESAFVVNVSDINETVPNRNPVVTTPVVFNGAEDTAIAGTLTASDPDGDVLGYTLGSVPTKGTVTMNASTGAFTYTPTPNSYGSDSFGIVVSDGKGGTATATVNVLVAAINDTPTSIGFTGGPIAENSTNGAVIGTLSTVDVDVGDTFSFTLVNGIGSVDNSLVSIVGNQLRVNGAIDFETNPTLELRIRSTDQGNLFTERTLVVNVADVTESATAGADNITGTAAADTINALAGNDTVNGLGGNDIIRGGSGVDVLTGGGGADQFVFDTPADLFDSITDFSTADSIVIEGSAFSLGTYSGALSTANLRIISNGRPIAADANDYFIFRSNDDTLWFDADGTGSIARVLLADLNDVTFTSANILII